MFQCRKATVLTWRRARFHHLQEHTKRNSYVDWRSRTTIHSRLLNQIRLFPREHLQPKKALYSHRWTSQHFKSIRTGAKRACLSLGHKGQLQCGLFSGKWHVHCGICFVFLLIFPPEFGGGNRHQKSELYLHWSGWVAAKIAPGVDEVGKWPDVRSFGKLQQKGSNKTPLFRIFSWANVRKFQYLQPNYNNLAAPGEPTRRRDKHVDEIWCIFTCCINARISYCRTSLAMDGWAWKTVLERCRFPVWTDTSRCRDPNIIQAKSDKATNLRQGANPAHVARNQPRISTQNFGRVKLFLVLWACSRWSEGCKRNLENTGTYRAFTWFSDWLESMERLLGRTRFFGGKEAFWPKMQRVNQLKIHQTWSKRKCKCSVKPRPAPPGTILRQ